MKKHFGLFVFVFVAACATQAPQRHLAPTVLLVSIDGFRSDYLSLYSPATLNQIAAEGVRAEGLIPVFPSLTFPNHYSIVTGLYPEHHGIVANSMWNPSTDKDFALSKVDAIEDPSWWLGEPLWVTAIQQGQRAGTMFWPGSSTRIKGLLPTYFKRYDPRVGRAARVDQVLQWLDLPDAERPTFLTLYLEEVDHAGHEAGPETPEMGRAVAQVDESLAQLWRGLHARGLSDEINVVIVSDHGMTSIDPTKVLALGSVVNDTQAKLVGNGTLVNVFPRDVKETTAIYKRLRDLSPLMKVYLKDEIPARFHYRLSPRIGAIVCMAGEHAFLATGNKAPSVHGGTHGYDNGLPSMRGIFIAHGPAFRVGATIPAFENINIYAMLSGVLGLKPAPNDGDARVLAAALKSPVVAPAP